MQSTRSYEARPELKATAHKLTAIVGGVKFAVEHLVTYEAYSALDPKDVTKIIDSYLWEQLMHSIEHNLRKNLTHA